MIKLSDNKGITLIALLITIIIIMILAVSVTVSNRSTTELREYYKVKEDIIALTEEVQIYYLKNEELPTKGGAISFSIPAKDKNPNDNSNYYEIDNTKLNVQLKKEDYTYIVNEESLTVYCQQGISLKGEVHYTIADDFQGGSYASEYYENVELPIISLVSFTSNENNKNYATDKSVLTLKILKNYNFTVQPTVTINGTSVTPTWNGRIGTATYVVEGDKCTEGQEIPFSISNYSADGRTGDTITRPTFGNVVIYKTEK